MEYLDKNQNLIEYSDRNQNRKPGQILIITNMEIGNALKAGLRAFRDEPR